MITKVENDETAKGLQQQSVPPRSLAIFSEGIATSRDFARGMSALMSDLIGGKISPQVGNAVVNAGGKLLKVVEMQQKYGVQNGTGERKTLELAG